METSDQPSTAEAIRDITESTRQAFAASERIAADLETLERRFKHATDWRARIEENPLWLAGAAVIGGIILWRIFR
ncbi:MAG TPA: hypothetical protein VKX39_15245 [Bryobacteraceae bacterium]|jgi:hypothetical protein|nr:hypothetical protein [Bryobacteraceae bacterium]